MFSKQDLKEYGIAYYVFARLKTSAEGDMVNGVPQMITFRDQLYIAEAYKGDSREVRVVLRDFNRKEVIAELTSTEQLLEVLING